MELVLGVARFAFSEEMARQEQSGDGTCGGNQENNDSGKVHSGKFTLFVLVDLLQIGLWRN